MTLRSRLVLTLVLTALPIIGTLALFVATIERQLGAQMLRNVILSRVESLGRERCEADPALIGGVPSAVEIPRDADGPWRGAGTVNRPTLAAYDEQFRSSDPNAQSFPPELKAQLSESDAWATATLDRGGRPLLHVAMRTRWSSGPCAYVVAVWPDPMNRNVGLVGPPRTRGFWRQRVVLLIAPIGAVMVVLMVAVWFAMGPVVRRVRSLGREVRESAKSRYQQPVWVRGNDEIADLARAFNAAGSELRRHLESVEHREEALRSFLAHTTHDVMIPLTVLQGHITAIQRSLDQNTAVSREQVAGAADEADYIGALLHNLGAVAKLEAGDGLVQSDPIDLNALVERVVERHRPLASVRAIEIEFAVPPGEPVRALGDLTLLEQAVGNLVANAIRHNEAGRHVAVSLASTSGPPHTFQIRIVDDGPGVPDELRGRLSERGWRADAARQRYPDGLGLGLHIARTVADRHGFTLRFSRSSFGGLEATIEGPAYDSRDRREAARREEPRA